jgi:hypothetical protein
MEESPQDSMNYLAGLHKLFRHGHDGTEQPTTTRNFCLGSATVNTDQGHTMYQLRIVLCACTSTHSTSPQHMFHCQEHHRKNSREGRPRFHEGRPTFQYFLIMDKVPVGLSHKRRGLWHFPKLTSWTNISCVKIHLQKMTSFTASPAPHMRPILKKNATYRHSTSHVLPYACM